MELAKYLSGFLYDPRNEILPFPQKKIYLLENKIKYSCISNCPLSTNHLSPASVSSFSVAILIPTRTDIEPSCRRQTQRPIPAAARCTRAACALSPIAGRPKRRGLGGLALPPPAASSRLSGALFGRPAQPTLPRLLNLENSFGKLPSSFSSLSN